MKPNKLGWMLIVLFIMAPSVWAQDEDERLDGGYYSLIDRSTGQVVTMTARHLDPGDTYISADNREYRVEAIDGDESWSVSGEIELPAISEGAELSDPALAQDSNDGPMGFITHSAESYVPTSGTDKETGDIFEVGKSFQQALEQLGLRVCAPTIIIIPMMEAPTFARGERSRNCCTGGGPFRHPPGCSPA